MCSCASSIDLQKIIIVKAVDSSNFSINLNILQFIWATEIIKKIRVCRLLSSSFFCLTSDSSIGYLYYWLFGAPLSFFICTSSLVSRVLCYCVFGQTVEFYLAFCTQSQWFPIQLRDLDSQSMQGFFCYTDFERGHSACRNFWFSYMAPL